MKTCTMNCGPALGDTRSEEQRRADCTDCAESSERPIHHAHIVVIGHMCGDDEDHRRFYKAMAREQAIAAYKNDVYESEGYTQEDRERDESMGGGVVVNLVLASDSPIRVL